MDRTLCDSHNRDFTALPSQMSTKERLEEGFFRKANCLCILWKMTRNSFCVGKDTGVLCATRSHRKDSDVKCSRSFQCNCVLAELTRNNSSLNASLSSRARLRDLGLFTVFITRED